jgi:hypothetical protein
MSKFALAFLASLSLALPGAAATITGIARNAENAAPLAAMTVVAYDSSGIARVNATTDANGHYTLSLAAGSYRVLAYDLNGVYATSFFDGAESFETSALLNLQTALTANFSLVRAGTIAGTITARSSGPLAGVTVAVYNISGTLRGSTQTDAAGHYQLSVPPGTFKLAAWDDALAYATTFYADAATFTTASVLAVNAGATSTANITLGRVGHVRGIVTDELNGAGVANAIVTAYDANGLVAATAIANAGGAYDLAVRAGAYRLVFEERSGVYASAFYANAESFETEATIDVAEGASRDGVNAALPRGVPLQGLVLDAASGAGLANMIAAAYNPSGTVRAFATTDSAGRYRILVPIGDYKVGAYDPSLVYATRFSVAEASFATAQTLHVVASQQLANLNLLRGGQFAGTVRTVAGIPLAGITVAAYASSGVLIASAQTNADGTYRIVVAPGTYTLAAFDRSLHYVTSTTTTPIAVAPAEVQPRDFTLAAGATMRALVRDLATHAAIAGIIVAAYDSAGTSIAAATTDANGTAGIALPSGTYRFVASDRLHRYATSYYANADSFEHAVATTIVAGQPDLNLTFNLTTAPTPAAGRHRAVRH